MIPIQYRQLFINSKIINNNYFYLEPGPDSGEIIGNTIKLITNLDTTVKVFGNDNFKPDSIEYLCYATIHDSGGPGHPFHGGVGFWSWLGEVDIRLSDQITYANYAFCGCGLMKKKK